ncbi:paraquat-inducible protein A [Phyllobacterium meliloti]|uniref:paraquat-inducible protein A n=1 Tax=Phyllobacterium meliloti TaxID=555317 RepID=UPI001D14B3E1|nr:paraquat-inducible protein A [Phyllobacterium sp. T1293]UGX86467.1 paraquat-inducible protein A [Phyllobacterium sp. T1293]
MAATRFLIPIFLFIATFSLALGLTMPLMNVSKLYFFDENPSLVGLIAALWTGGDWLLAVIVSLFSVILPIGKLAVAQLAAAHEPIAARLLHRWIGILSKWSMLDVLLVALVIFAAKTSGLATAIAQPGLWFFAASAILSAIATHFIVQREKAESQS